MWCTSPSSLKPFKEPVDNNGLVLAMLVTLYRSGFAQDCPPPLFMRLSTLQFLI